LDDLHEEHTEESVCHGPPHSLRKPSKPWSGPAGAPPAPAGK